MSGLRGKDRPTRGGRSVKDAFRAGRPPQRGGSGPPGLWQALLSVPAQQSRWQLEVRLSGFGFCASGAGDLSQGLSVSPGVWSLCSAFGKQPAEIGRGEAKRVWISDVEASAAPPPVPTRCLLGRSLP